MTTPHLEKPRPLPAFGRLSPYLLMLVGSSIACGNANVGDENRDTNSNPSALNSVNAIQGLGGLCLDAKWDSALDGTKVQLWTCNGTDAQNWVSLAGQLLGPGQKCLDVTGGGSASGTDVELWHCNGGSNQQWNFASDGTLRGIANKCLDVAVAVPSPGDQAVLMDCNGSPGQQWAHRGQGGGAPTNLKYSSNPLNATLGQAIALDAPSSGGGAPTSYSVSPPLPAGLLLNVTTGVITGTPTVVTAASNHTIVAMNAAGRTQATLSVAVVKTSSTDCGMFPCFDALYPHSPLLAPVPSNPKLDAQDRTLVASLFNPADSGNAAAGTTSAYPLYSSTCADPGYVVNIGQPTWWANQPQGQTVHFPAGAVWEPVWDEHISVFDSCPSSYGVWDAWASSKLSGGVFNAQTVTRMPAFSVPANCVADSNHYSTCAADGLGSAQGHAGIASAAVVRPQELLNGSIDHALILVAKCSSKLNGVFPAVQTPPDSPCSTGGVFPTYGQRFYLALSDAQIDGLFPQGEEWKKPYWKAMSRFGAYISDMGWNSVQIEATDGYKALQKPNPWDALAAKYGPNYPPDFRPSDPSAWNTLYQNIHAFALDAPRPVGP